MYYGAMTNMSVEAAEYRLREAQAQYDAAVQEQAVLNSFGRTTELYAVMAKVPSFDQFISYPAEGKLVAVFADEDSATAFVAAVKAPAGTHLVIEPAKTYGL